MGYSVSLGGEKIKEVRFDTMVSEGHEALWKMMEEYYYTMFKEEK